MAFLSIGLNRITDLMGIEANLGLLPWFGPIVVAQIAGVWLGRKYLRRAPKPLATV